MSNVLSEFVKANCQKAERGRFHDWPAIVEEKIKGRRVFLWNSNGKTVMATKFNGIYDAGMEVKGVKVWEQVFKELEVAPGSILDCELWPERYGAGEPTLYVFDVLYAYRNDVRGRTLLERKKLLLELVKQTAHVKVLPHYIAKGPAEAEKIKEEVVAAGGEGIMLKADVPYGRPGSWVKDKAEETVDCFVTGFGKGEKGETTYFVGVNENDAIKVLGEVYSAVNGVDRKEIRLDSVLEVRFGVVDGELIFPGTILRSRDDKKPEECLADQWGN